MINSATAWKWMPATLLLATVIFAWWRVDVVLDDPHHGEVENAYDTAEQWDSHSALLRASANMPVEFKFVKFDSDGDVEATFEGADSEAINLIGFHNAYPSQESEIQLTRSNDGIYRGNIGAVRPGIWRFELSAVVNEQQWLFKQRMVVPLK
ncbi:MAG: FixH family protein [Planctomycetota bacterium]|nr:FixH family protein [Planctomycetota bacterium]